MGAPLGGAPIGYGRAVYGVPLVEEMGAAETYQLPSLIASVARQEGH